MPNVYFISIKSQLKQTSRLMKAIVEIKLGTRNMFRIPHNCLICYCLSVYLLWYFNTNCNIDLLWIFMLCNMVGIFKVALAALFNMLPTSRSCGNICCFNQNYQAGKIILQDSVIIIKLWLLCLLDNLR